jgi:hypothetical protein
VAGTGTSGQAKLTGTSTAKITDIKVNALGASKWDDAPSSAGTAGSMNPVVSNQAKFYAAKGASTMGVMGASAVSITGAGLSLTDNVTLFNLLSNSSWKVGTTSTTSVSTAGAIPTGGTTAANMRIILTTNP